MGFDLGTVQGGGGWGEAFKLGILKHQRLQQLPGFRDWDLAGKVGPSSGTAALETEALEMERVVGGPLDVFAHSRLSPPTVDTGDEGFE